DGGTLMDKMRDANGALAWPEALKYLQQAALAIDYAHSRQVIHRDVKPGNLLLRQDGWLHLADFGISKVLLSEETRTHAGSGTPEYMAPEQARGDAVAASDRYSLAIIAYMLLTGYVPFSGKTPYDTLFKHLTESPPSPCELNPELSPQTEAVLLRGLEKTPGKRYPSCKQFVEDLERSYQGRSLLLPPLSQQLRDISHLPAARSPFVIPQLDQAPPSNPPAATMPTMPLPEPASPPMTKSHRKINRRTALIVGGSTLAAAAGATGLVALRSSFFSQGNTSRPQMTPPTPPPAGPLHLIPAKPLLKLTEHHHNVWDVAWDPGGRYLASYDDQYRVLLWDLDNALHTQGGNQDTITSVSSWILPDKNLCADQLCWSPDGHTLAIASSSDVSTSNVVYLADVLTHNSKPRKLTNNSSMPPFSIYRSPAWSPGGKQLAAANSNLLGIGSVDVWQVDKMTDPSYRLSYTRPGETGGDVALALDWSHDGSKLAGVIPNLDIVIWNTQKRQVEQVLPQPTRPVHQVKINLLTSASISWSPTDPYLLAAWNFDSISIYDTRQKKPLYQLFTDDREAIASNSPLHPLQLFGFIWSPNGRYLAGCYSGSRNIYIWDLQAKNPGKTRDGLQLQSMVMSHIHTDTVTNLSWSPNGRYLASSSLDKTVVISQVDQ
ncbi:MAG: protein kinase, partial [Ktedonobacteraceae bacterium]|nr:protein kinase [Ktedonobacteraceae bacterium]